MNQTATKPLESETLTPPVASQPGYGQWVPKAAELVRRTMAEIRERERLEPCQTCVEGVR